MRNVGMTTKPKVGCAGASCRLAHRGQFDLVPAGPRLPASQRLHAAARTQRFSRTVERLSWKWLHWPEHVRWFLSPYPIACSQLLHERSAGADEDEGERQVQWRPEQAGRANRTHRTEKAERAEPPVRAVTCVRCGRSCLGVHALRPAPRQRVSKWRKRSSWQPKGAGILRPGQ